MNKLAKLKQSLHDLKVEATQLLDAADNDNDGILSEEQENRYIAFEAKIEEINTQVEAEEKRVARRADMQVLELVSVPAAVASAETVERAATYGFRNIGEMARAVMQATHPSAPERDQRLFAAPTNYHEGGGTSGEGFLLPTAFRNEIWEAVAGVDSLLTDVDLEPTSARQVEMLRDETTPWGSSGVQAYWRAEAAQMTASKLDTKGSTVPLHELYAFVLATEEMLEDAPRLNSRIQNKAPQAIAWKASDALVYGNGAGQPKGWMNSSALVSVAKESGQSADTINATNVLNMYSRLLVVPGDSPYWLSNRDIVPQLATMTIGNVPIWSPPSGLAAAPGGFLLGMPVRYSEHAKTLGDKGDIQLISPKGYYAARRTAGEQYAESIHLFFDYNIKAFRFIFRFGGQPHLSAPVSPANGSNTKSHFVVLDERA